MKFPRFFMMTSEGYVLRYIWGKVLFICWLAITILSIVIHYADTPTKDFMLVRNACPDSEFIEARAETIIWGQVSKLVFYCK